MSSIIRDIEIARAAGFIEHPVEPKSIVYTHNKETAAHSQLLPNVSWTPAGGGLADNAILSDGYLLYFAPNDGNLLTASYPYTNAANANGRPFIRTFEYYRYPKTTYPAKISLSCAPDGTTDTWTWDDPYSDPQQKIATGWRQMSYVVPELLQLSNALTYDNALDCWYAQVKFSFYRIDTETGDYIYEGGSSYLSGDVIQLDPAGHDFLNFISTKNALTAQT